MANKVSEVYLINIKSNYEGCYGCNYGKIECGFLSYDSAISYAKKHKIDIDKNASIIKVKIF